MSIIENPDLKTILVIKHGALGDIIFAMGAFKAIRNFHHQHKIILLTSSPFKKIAEKMNLFDEIWIDNRPPLWKFWLWWKLFRKIHHANVSRIYDLQRSKRSKIYYYFLKIFLHPFPQWSGHVRTCALPFVNEDKLTQHIFDVHRAQLNIAGISSVPDPDLNWLHESIDQFNLPNPYFLLVPGCSASQQHKRWPAENFALIAQKLVQQKITPVILGTVEEQDAIKYIQQICPTAISLMGKTTLWQIPELARGAIGALGHDTGPMHMITIADCPSLLLFSYSSIPARCGPRHSHSTVLKSEHLKDIPAETVYNSLRFRNNTNR